LVALLNGIFQENTILSTEQNDAIYQQLHGVLGLKIQHNKVAKQTPWLLVHKRTIPTDRPERIAKKLNNQEKYSHG
jgi:hypothetical protein